MLLSVALGLFVFPLHADEGMWLPAEVPSRAMSLWREAFWWIRLSFRPKTVFLVPWPPWGIARRLCRKRRTLGDQCSLHACLFAVCLAGVSKDLMEEGFMAADRSGEDCPLARVRGSFSPETISDVTERVLKRAKGRRLKDAERFQKVDRARKEIASECEEASADRRCRVIAFDGGLAYKLVVEREIRDVRLVYAPSDAIAMFGGETDNWMWPRHCGDFAFLRAYVGADGESADYGTDNVPLEVERFFPLSDAGVQDGDFVWMAGFPGSTYRTRSAAEGIHAATDRYPKGIEIFTELMDILRGHAKTNRDARIKLKNAMFGLSNQKKATREWWRISEKFRLCGDQGGRACCIGSVDFRGSWSEADVSVGYQGLQCCDGRANRDSPAKPFDGSDGLGSSAFENRPNCVPLVTRTGKEQPGSEARLSRPGQGSH